MHGWVWRENLRPFLEMVASLARYEFDQWDLDAVLTGLGDSDADEERWFRYPFGDEPQVVLGFSADRDGDEVGIEAEFDARGERFADRVACC